MAGPSTYGTINLALGPLCTVVGKLRTVKASDKSGGVAGHDADNDAGDSPAVTANGQFHRLCPGNHDAPARLTNRLNCEEGWSAVANGRSDHGPFTQDDCTHKATMVGDEMVVFTNEEVQAIRDGNVGVPDPTTLDLVVHDAADVAHLFRTGIAYLFVPDGVRATQMVGMLRDLAAEPDKVWMGEVTLRKKRKVFILERSPHGLLLVEVCRPEAVFDQPEVSYEYPEGLIDAGLAMMEALYEPFDPERYRAVSTERLHAAIDAKEGRVPAPITAVPAAPKSDDLEAMLLASLDAARAKKEAA